MRGLLILFAMATAWAQPPRTIFPSDSKHPKQSGGAALLEAVCPGRVIIGKEIGCRGVCPEFTGFAKEDFGWHLAAVTRGHFVSAQSDDAALWMMGCEPHSENWGGTILLTRRAQTWTMLWYKAGVGTGQCHKVKLRDREILVCLDGYGGQGLIGTGLWVQDLRNATPTLIAGGDDRPFLEIWDNTGSCGENPDDESKPEPLQRAYIEKVEFKSAKVGVPGISVTAHSGERKMTRQDVNICIEQNRTKGPRQVSFLPPTRREQIDFHFENGTYRRSPTARK